MLLVINCLFLVEDFQGDSDACALAQRWSTQPRFQTASVQN